MNGGPGGGGDIGDLRRRRAIRENRRDLADAAETDHGVASEFRMVGDQEDAPGVFDDGLRHPHLAIVEIQQGAVLIDAADPDNPDIDFELADEIHGRFADHAAVFAADHAAGDNDLEIPFRAHEVGYVEVVGDDTKPLVPHQRAGHFFIGGADIDEQRRMIRNLSRRNGGNVLLFRMVLILTGRIGDVRGAGRQAGAAVVALQHVAVTEEIDVAADRLRGDVKVLGQRFDGDEPLTLHHVHDLLLTLIEGRVHYFGPRDVRFE